MFMKRFLALGAVALVTVAACAQWSNPAVDIPDYNPSAPTHPLPPMLKQQQLAAAGVHDAYVVTVYRMAEKASPVLHQMPCYCRCDRAMGHNSLHSCFEGTHGAECSTCMQEAVFTYNEIKRGRTPAQIRAAIEHGDYLHADYQHPVL